MDLEQFLWLNLCNHSSNTLSKLVDDYVKNLRNAKEMLDILINIYGKKLVSKNVWVHQKIIDYCIKFEEEKKDLKKCRKICIEIISILLSLDEQEFMDIELKPDIINRIAKISYTFEVEYKELDDFRNVLLGNVYTLFNAVFGILIYKKNISDAHIITKYLCSLKQNQIFFRNDNKNITVFALLFEMLSRIKTGAHISTYINLSRDLFFYGNKNSNNNVRHNFIMTCIDICVLGDITNQEIDIKPLINSMKPKSKFTYLFTLHNYDYETICKIERDKANTKVDRGDRKFKTVSVQGCSLIEHQSKNPIDLIKTISPINK